MISQLMTRLRNNPDFGGAVLTSHGVIGLQVLSQLILVPLYLVSLGKTAFGILMVLIAVVSMTRVGIGWLSGRMMRSLSESFSQGNLTDFNTARHAFRIGFGGYGVAVGVLLALVGSITPAVLFGETPEVSRIDIALAAATMGLHAVFLSLLGVEYTALSAQKRRTVGNLILALSIAVYLITVVPVLLAGGGLVAATACLALGTVVAYLVALAANYRVLHAAHMREVGTALERLARAIGPQGKHYAIYGAAFLLQQADIVIVGILGGAEAAAEFVLVWKAAEIIILSIWRISESLQPDLIQMDVRGERDRLGRVYREGFRAILACSAVAGLAYGAMGHWLVSLWVGADAAPDVPLAYALAGGAIFWLGTARLPSIFAFALVALGPLNRVAVSEALGRLALTILLFPHLGILAPLVAVNVVHVSGCGFAYVRLGRRLVNRPGRGRPAEA